MGNASLQALLGNNVVELHFIRRHFKNGWDISRGLFGTTNFSLLNGDFGKQVLFFQPPIGVGMGYPYKSYNLCVVWDIFRQEYRVFGAEQVSIKQQWDVTTEEGQEEFKKYFFDFIHGMSEQDKLDFMGYEPMMAMRRIPDKPVTVKKTKPSATPKPPTTPPERKPSVKERYKGFMKRVGDWFKGKK